MAATPESRTKDALRGVLRAIRAHLPPMQDDAHPDHCEGLWFWWLQPGYGQAGAPDLIGRLHGRFFAVEAKADPCEGGRPPRPVQQRELAAIRASGGLSHQWVGVVGDAESFDTWRWWMLEHTAWPNLTPTTMEALRADVLAVPWRTHAARTRREAPPVLRIRSKRS